MESGKRSASPHLWSPSLDSILRASLRLSKIAPGDFVASLHAGYLSKIVKIQILRTLSIGTGL